MPNPVFPRSTPSAQGVDPAGVEAFLDEMDAHPEVELHSLMVLRHGHVVAEGWWAPYTPERVHLLYSLSKSFTSTAAGFAVAEGLLDLDATVLSLLPGAGRRRHRRAQPVDVGPPRRRDGQRTRRGDHRAGVRQRSRTTWSAASCGSRRSTSPARWFAYNQPCTYTLAAIVQRESGQAPGRLPRPTVVRRRSASAGWAGSSTRPAASLGFTGLHATTDADRQARPALPAARLVGRPPVAARRSGSTQATRLQVANPREDNPDWRQGYGFQFWLARHGYRGDGAYGQFCVVLPEQDDGGGDHRSLDRHAGGARRVCGATCCPR